MTIHIFQFINTTLSIFIRFKYLFIEITPTLQIGDPTRGFLTQEKEIVWAQEFPSPIIFLNKKAPEKRRRKENHEVVS